MTEPARPLHVLYVASECAPWSKTGGLADVSAALPAALRALGIDARVLMPLYPTVPRNELREFAHYSATARLPEARVVAGELPNRVPIFLVNCPALYDRAGGPYQDEAGHDWNDNARRFALLARIAANLGSSGAEGWQADIVHCHDWQTGLAPAYMRYGPQPHAASVFTIHNLAFQGIFPADIIEQIELPAASFNVDGVEFYGQCSFLKAGLAYADALTTVSPTYAMEIQRESHGMGLHGLLQNRSDTLTGILNGIDTEVWSPASDRHIARRYDAATLERKVHNKRALQERLRLPQTDAPLLAVVSRLTDQKGIDWVFEIASAIAQLPAQLVLLGRGDERYEAAARGLAQAMPQSVSATIAFDDALAHQIEAGADTLLMPSRFEPCGMNQLYSQRYGTVPIVRATGGLADSVDDFSAATGAGTGFVYREPSARALLATIKRALVIFRDRASWRRLQRNGMSRDFSWDASARRYAQIYEHVASTKNALL